MLEEQIRDLIPISRDRRVPDAAEADEIAARAVGGPLSFEEINALLCAIGSPRFPEVKARVLARSARVRREVFGDAVVPMAPVETSNICASDCLFCGWRASNTRMKRVQISEELIMAQVRYLVRKGICYIEFVGGDDFNFVRTTLPSLIASTRELAREEGVPLKVCFCTMSLTERHYRELREAGADSMIVWQETYSQECYRREIAGGPKARGITDDWRLRSNGDGFAFRLHAQERALEAGLEVALGTILGLNENLNYEVLAAVAHARYLIERYGLGPDAPVIIGMPTWNPITTPATDNRPAGRPALDDAFSYLAAVYFLSLPRGAAWVFPNCRVGIGPQIEAVEAAGVFTSTEVKLGPGGYLPALLGEMRRRGEDTTALEARIVKELGAVPDDLARMEENLDRQEQFCHHHHPHEAYLEEMRRRGLTVVRSPVL